MSVLGSMRSKAFIFVQGKVNQKNLRQQSQRTMKSTEAHSVSLYMAKVIIISRKSKHCFSTLYMVFILLVSLKPVDRRMCFSAVRSSVTHLLQKGVNGFLYMHMWKLTKTVADKPSSFSLFVYVNYAYQSLLYIQACKTDFPSSWLLMQCLILLICLTSLCSTTDLTHFFNFVLSNSFFLGAQNFNGLYTWYLEKAKELAGSFPNCRIFHQQMCGH